MPSATPEPTDEQHDQFVDRQRRSTQSESSEKIHEFSDRRSRSVQSESAKQIHEFDNPLVDTDDENYPDDGLDPKTKSRASNGVAAWRKYDLVETEVPYSRLAVMGVEIPHREYNPDEQRQFPTTVTCTGDDESVTVHLFQDVREDFEDTFGSFGDLDDAEDVIWTVTDLTDGTVNLVVVGDWGKRREVEYDEFADNYDPLTVETGQGESPKFGY